MEQTFGSGQRLKNQFEAELTSILFKFYDSSFVVRTKLMPAMKNIKPSIPYMASALISFAPSVPFTNNTAA